MVTKTVNNPPAKLAEHVDPETGEITETDTKSLTKAEDGKALVARSTQDDFDGYAADAGAGYENQTSDDILLPFLSVMQPGSPDVQGEDAPAKAGMFKNTVTGEFISGKTGFTFVPATTQHLMVEWIPKDPKTGAGGGYVGPHEIDSELASKVRREQPLGKYKHPTNGNDLIETFYVYGLLVDEHGNGNAAVLTFSSTFIKAYKAWMYIARSITLKLPDGRKLTKLPLFSHAYNIRTEMNTKGGNTWYTPVVGFAGKDAADSRLPASSDLYLTAKGVCLAVNDGSAKLATETLSNETVDQVPEKGDTDAEKAPY